MIIIDANLLLYAYLPASPQHTQAKTWLETTLSGTESVGIPWTALLAFVRIATNEQLHKRPLTQMEAADIVSSWFAQPQVVLLAPSERHWLILRRLLIESQVHGPMVMDADIAALAIDRGATLCTGDHDFLRFHGLRMVNPVAPRNSG